MDLEESQRSRKGAVGEGPREHALFACCGLCFLTEFAFQTIIVAISKIYHGGAFWYLLEAFLQASRKTPGVLTISSWHCLSMSKDLWRKAVADRRLKPPCSGRKATCAPSIQIVKSSLIAIAET